MRNVRDQFGDITVRQYACRKKDVMAIQYGKSDLLMRPIMRTSGTGRQEMVALYPVDFTLTHEENAERCFNLLCQLAGVDPRDVKEMVNVPMEDSLATPGKPAEVSAL